MKNFGIAILLGMAVLCGCSAAYRSEHPEDLEFTPLAFELPQVETFQLANGVRVFFREDHELPLVSVTTMLNAGKIDEPENRSGLAELHATAMRSAGAGDMTADEIDAYLEMVAADLSVTSDAYATTLSLSLQSADVEQGLRVLGDMMRRPRFDAQRVELARRRMLENIRRQNDRPAVVARRAFLSALYRNHSLGRLPTLDSVGTITLEDLRAFHKRFFKPDNLWVAVSGDIDRAALEGYLNDALGDWSGRFDRPKDSETLPPPAPPALWLAYKDVPQTTLLMGERGIDKNDPDLYALRVLDFILGGGSFNSRLMQNIRTRRGLAYSVYSYFQVGRRLPGVFIAGAETKNSSVSDVTRLMRQEMQTLMQTPVTQEELKTAKESLINSFVFAFEDTHEVVTRVMRLAFYGYPGEYLSRYRQRLAAVTAEDVLAVARRHLHPEAQTLIMVGNPEQPDDIADALGLPLKTVDLEGFSSEGESK